MGMVVDSCNPGTGWGWGPRWVDHEFTAHMGGGEAWIRVYVWTGSALKCLFPTTCDQIIIINLLKIEILKLSPLSPSLTIESWPPWQKNTAVPTIVQKVICWQICLEVEHSFFTSKSPIRSTQSGTCLLCNGTTTIILVKWAQKCPVQEMGTDLFLSSTETKVKWKI